MSPRPRIPKYLRISDQLRLRIRMNGRQAGDRLPSEMDLCAEFEASRGTVRKALGLLVKEGIIRRNKRAGTTVIAPRWRPARRKLLCGVMPNAFNPEFVRFMCTFRGRAVESGYWTHALSSNFAPAGRERFLEEIAQAGAAGVVVLPHPLDGGRLYDWLRAEDVPYVVVNDFWTDCRGHDHIAYDEAAGVSMAVHRLADLGHKRLALIETDSGWARSRAIARFLDALTKHDLPSSDANVFLCDPCAPPLERLFGKGGLNPTALVTLYDVSTTAVIPKLRKLRLRVPEDVSVVNVGCRPIAELAGVDVTSVEAPHERMAELALRFLLEKRSWGEARQHLFRPAFHEGNTCAPLRAAAASCPV